MKRIIAISIVSVLVGALAVSAAANEARFSDRDDVSGRLDIRWVAHGHSSEEGILRHEMRTFARWGPKALARTSFLAFYFSTDDEDQFAEYRIMVDKVDGALQGCFQSYAETSDWTVVGPCTEIEVGRRDHRSVDVTFDRSLLGDGVSRYTWTASSNFRRSGTACERTCIDSAPVGRNGPGAPIEHVL